MTTNEDIESNTKDLQTRGVFPVKPTNVQTFSTSAPHATMTTIAEMVGVKRYVQTITLDSSSPLLIFFKRFDTDAYKEFSVNLIGLFKSLRWRIKYTFIVTSVQQHIGAFYAYWYPGSAYHKVLPFYYIVTSSQGSATTDMTASNFMTHATTPLPLRLACQLDTFKVFKLGKTFSFTLETEWNAPIANLISLNKPGENLIQIKPFCTDLGEMCVSMMYPYEQVAQSTAFPTFEIWREISFENLAVPIITPLAIPV